MLSLALLVLAAGPTADATDASVPAPPPAAAPAPAPAAPSGPTPVTVGVYVVQVNSIDLKTNSYTVDFWLWFRSKGRDQSPLDAFEIMDGRVTSKTNVIKKKQPDGYDYAAARINAVVHQQWDLHRFPFDDHELELSIEDAEFDVKTVNFVPDAVNQGVDPGVKVSGWEVTGLKAEVTPHSYHSNYGDTALGTNVDTQFSRYTVKIQAERRGVARFFKTVFALLISVLASWCAFFIRPKDASPRVSVSVGALFAGAAGTIALGTQLPDLNYPTVADKVVYLCLSMILLSLAGTVRSLGLHYQQQEAKYLAFDKRGALLFPIFFAVMLLIILL
ncbi:MAG: hypothetical protein U0228_07855 [Myxococcaceae bacterium]